MTTAITLARLRDLRPGGMAQALKREHRKHERLVRQARFKLRATVQDIDYQPPRNIQQAQIAWLAQGQWIERAQNLLITGLIDDWGLEVFTAAHRNDLMELMDDRHGIGNKWFSRSW